MAIRARNYWTQHAGDIIKGTYDDRVSVKTKAKDLLKFGRNNLIGTNKATIMTLPSGILNETYLATNGITTISSSATADTSLVNIEGHTIDSNGDFTFVTQTATLNGRNKVSLSIPLARSNRCRNASAVDLTGSIYLYEDTAIVAGVPTAGTKVHLIIDEGLNNSEKSATTISKDDYWLLTSFYGDCIEKASAFCIVYLEIRLKGGVFTNIIDISSTATGGRGIHKFEPYFIVPPNSDIRMRASADNAGTDVIGGIQGVLMSII